jgi:hypothetical protein
MAQVFHRSANTLARASILATLMVVAGSIWMSLEMIRSPYTTYAGVAKAQPVPFSHKHHVAGLGIDCRYCHTSVESSAFAGIPPVKTCMNCHSQIWTNAPMLDTIREDYRTGKPLIWTRLNDLPDFVYFDHSIHISKGVGCNECHGQVEQMPLTYAAKPLTMEWCLSCHRDPQKVLRPHYVADKPGQDQVFNMEYQQPSESRPVVLPNGMKFTDQMELGQYLGKQNKLRSVRDITSCNTCHR